MYYTTQVTDVPIKVKELKVAVVEIESKKSQGPDGILI